MNKKGFTLIELIVTIALLAIIGVSIGISLNRTIKAQKENEKKDYIKKVVSAANLYATNNKEILDSLYTNKGYVIIELGDIIDAGLINKNTINPETKEKISRTDKVKALFDARGSLIIEYPVSMPEEDYLRAMDIIVEYEDNSITDYCYYKINEPELSYITKEGNIKSGYLVPNTTIKCENISIDTKKLGTYELTYDYLLENGVWKKGTRRVIVSDNTAPVCGTVTGASTRWINTSRTITVGCNDNYKCVNTSETQTLSNRKTANITIEDTSHNSTGCTVNVYSDTVKPTNVTISAPAGLTATKTLTGRGTDALSGIKYYEFSTNENLTDISATGQSITPTTEAIEEQQIVLESGIYYFYVQDQAGNIKRSTTGVTVGIDNTPPYIELSVPNGTTYAKTNAGTVTIKDDGSGLTATPIKIYYKWSTSAVTCANIGTKYITITPTAEAKTASGTISITSGTGAGKLYICNKDAISDAGGTSLIRTLNSENMYLDNTIPTLTVETELEDGTSYSGQWTNQRVKAKKTFSDAHSGIDSSSLKWKAASSTGWSSLTNTSTSYHEDFWGSERNELGYNQICDNAGNCKDVSYQIRIDKTAPGITFSANSNTTWSKTKSVVVTINDGSSGLKSGGTVKYGWSSSNTIVPSTLTPAEISYTDGTTGNVTFTASGSEISGKRYLWVVPTIQDKAGNSATNTVSTGQFYFDNTKPTTPDMHFVFGDWTVFEGTWTNNNLYAGWAKADSAPQSTDAQSGIAKYQISTDNSTWTDFSYDNTKDLYKMQTEATHTRYFRAIDNVGLISDVKTVTGKIDKTDPTITITPATTSTSASSVKVRIKATDNTGGSGINASLLVYSVGTSISGSGTAFTNDTDVTVSLSAGANYITVKACDNAGNCKTQKSAAITRTTTTTTTTATPKVTINFDKNYSDGDTVSPDNFVKCSSWKGYNTYIGEVQPNQGGCGSYDESAAANGKALLLYLWGNIKTDTTTGLPKGAKYDTGLNRDSSSSYTWSLYIKSYENAVGDTFDIGFDCADCKVSYKLTNTYTKISKTIPAGKLTSSRFLITKNSTDIDHHQIILHSFELTKSSISYYSTGQQVVGANLTLPTAPTRTGYTFGGWFTAKTGGTQVTTSTKVPSSNTTYYAHWTSQGGGSATEGPCSFDTSGVICDPKNEDMCLAMGTYTSSCTNGTIVVNYYSCPSTTGYSMIKRCQNATCKVTGISCATPGCKTYAPYPIGGTYTASYTLASTRCQ